MKSSTLQDAIQDGGRKILVVQDLLPFAEWFVSGEDHRSFSQMTIVDDMKQDIGSIGTVA